MEISHKLKEVIIAIIAESGSITNFSRKIGINICNLSRYCSGKNKSISDDVWIKIRPAIVDYAKRQRDCSIWDNEPFKRLKPYTELPIDQQIILRKYGGLDDDRKLKIHELMDNMLHSSVVPETTGRVAETVDGTSYSGANPNVCEFRTNEVVGNYNSETN